MIISGKHHTHEEIIDNVFIRCKEKNINIVEIINSDEIFTTQKSVKIKYKCSKCEKEEIRNFYNMYINNRNSCMECINKNKGSYRKELLTREDLQGIINSKYKDKNFSFLVNNFIYKNNKTVVDIECTNCGLKDKSRIDLLKQGRKSCKCSSLRSILERDTRKILDEYEIEFQTEYSFDDLTSKIKLRFDFGIIIEGSLKLIECDGIQHFKPTFGEKAFEHTLKSDAMKNKYVIENDIPLLRIKYDDKNIREKIIEFIEL